MKSLEKKAEKYDKGIDKLTLGKLTKIKQYIVDHWVNSNDTLLDIGMGTGSFAIICAQKGAKVTGIDQSEKMLEVARDKINLSRINQKIDIVKMSIVELDKTFEANFFDKVTAILTFSELFIREQEFCLDQIYRILKENGEFILVDEVKPKKLWKRIVYSIVRIPLSFLTFVQSHLSTSALNNVEYMLTNHKFIIFETKYYLLNTLMLLRSKKINDNTVKS